MTMLSKSVCQQSQEFEPSIVSKPLSLSSGSRVMLSVVTPIDQNDVLIKWKLSCVNMSTTERYNIRKFG